MTISDIVTKIYFLTKTNSNSFGSANMLVLINNAYDRVASIISQSDGRWQWDDFNYSDLPIATTTLTANQQDYSIDSSHLTIEGIEIKDINGNWVTLTPIDAKDLNDAPSATDFMKISGQPTFYDKVGNSIFLYPAPNYTQAASLKVRFKRSPSYFTSAEITTGTKVPGFSYKYHDIIPLWVAYEYLYSNGLPTARAFLEEINRKEEALKEDIQSRSGDEPIRLRVTTGSPR